jgi:hypothetical protein
MRRTAIGIIIGALAVVGLPAVASHINEPITPIYDIALRVFDYPHAVTTLAKCDGTETVNWAEARVEVDVFAKSKPSEHFDVRVEYYEKLPDNRGRLNGYLWTQTWKHSNIPPHTPTERDRWEHASANQVLAGTKAGSFVVTVTGMESGVRFTEVCSYKVAP